MRRVAVFAAAGLLLAACSSGGKTASSSSNSSSPVASSSAADTFDLSGTVTLYGAISTGIDSMNPGAACMGILNNDAVDENYEDVTAGASVEVSDGSGATVGVGQLGNGVLGTVNPPDARTCAFPYSVSGVTGGRGFYRLTVGTHSTKTMPETEFRGIGDIDLKSSGYTAG
jgi:hypothetical protein